MNWSELNLDLLEEIARRIKLYDDFVAFSIVCSLCRSAAVKENFRFMSSHIPLLMLPSKGCSNSCGFFDLPKGMTRSILLPECDGKKCFSSKGWLITIDLDWNMSLLNPFSRVQIELSHMEMFENWEDLETLNMQVSFISKCALSMNLSLRADYILMVIYGGQIANLPIEFVKYKTKIYLVESVGALLVVTREAIEEETIFQIFVKYPEANLIVYTLRTIIKRATVFYPKEEERI
ncbi:hypothetical protein JRO89_XS13G0169000 [Xanthoceras sorbifolium]|uniref:F-box domain-containing protein n=1 Tax=Xanthoceras sorbifolium TaxID=99658 RepID=A0ABQ8H8T0_9ROSI|nr:hypothetical protein JRO89_XS13G0169000 [Xanthoceras sorbifolium]